MSPHHAMQCVQHDVALRVATHLQLSSDRRYKDVQGGGVRCAICGEEAVGLPQLLAAHKVPGVGETGAIMRKACASAGLLKHCSQRAPVCFSALRGADTAKTPPWMAHTARHVQNAHALCDISTRLKHKMPCWDSALETQTSRQIVAYQRHWHYYHLSWHYYCLSWRDVLETLTCCHMKPG